MFAHFQYLHDDLRRSGHAGVVWNRGGSQQHAFPKSANGKVMRSGVALERSEIPYELHVCVLVRALSPYVPRIPERPWEPR